MNRPNRRRTPVQAARPSGGGIQTILAAVLLATATVAVYLPVGRHDFLNYDDNVYVTDNWHVRQGLSWESLRWAFTDTRQSSNWHPLTWLSHMADTELFGAGPAGPHYVNVGLHTLNVLLLFGFLLYTTQRLWTGAIVAALFALHPLHVESVAWVAERKDVLSAFFWLATMWAWAFYARTPGLGRYIAAIVLFALGLMAKPMLVTLPLVLLLVDYWPLERFTFSKDLWRKGLRYAGPDVTAWGLIAEKIPLAALSAASSVMTLIAQRNAMAALEAVDFSTRLTNAVVSYGRYIGAMFWPAGLAAFYPHPREPLYWQAALVAVMLAAVTAAVLVFGRKRRFLITGWLWYLLTLVPVIGLVQVGDQSHADRYTYIPLTGLFVALAWLGAEIAARRPALKPAAVVLAITVICGMGAMTVRTLGYWRNDEVLCRRALAVTSGNYVMNANLAVLLATQNRFDEANCYAAEALLLRPDEATIAHLMGGLAASRKDYEEALGWFMRAMETGSEFKELQFNTGSVLMSLNRPAEAVQFLRRATELDPHWSEAFSLLGTALISTGEAQAAAEAIRRSLSLTPGTVRTFLDLAPDGPEQQRAPDIETAYAQLSNTAGRLAAEGNLKEAENYCLAAIELRPQVTFGYYNLAKVLAAQGQTDEAIETLRIADRIKPGDPETQKQLKLLTESQSP